MKLNPAQTDRAAGVILGGAVGDALGVPYEFATPPGPGQLAEMRGGGLGNFAPGEWSDDTSMAAAIARVAATGADLTSDEALDAIAAGFLQWYDSRPADIGIQTRQVLGAVAHDERNAGLGSRMTTAAQTYADTHPRSAGNGALMRTAPVALAHLDDRQRLAQAARAVAALTHADPLAGDSCVLWCEAIRVAVLEGRFELAAGLDLLPERGEEWAAWIADAEANDPATFTPNGFTVTALQAAWAAITQTPIPDSMACAHLQSALHAAIRIGNDTDTVAAIAGSLLGARWGASALPWDWRRAVHGWPGLDGRDLVAMATKTVSGGHCDGTGWPDIADVNYTVGGGAAAVAHPHDAGVLLGTTATRGHGADAVVSACRVGVDQACFDGAKEVVESRLLDSEDPAVNPNLEWVLLDAARAIKGLRDEGKTVFVHCVAAQQRTPSIAVAYSRLLGYAADEAARDVQAVLASTRGSGLVWEVARG